MPSASKRRLILTLATLALGLVSTTALAELSKIQSRDQFVQTVSGKHLTLLGIKLNVTSGGQIDGRAYGRNVSGRWQWRDGYFCRDLYWGQTDLGPNCQEVRVNGNKIRFTSDRGTGRYADLTLR